MKLYEYDFMDEKEYAIGFNKGSSFVFLWIWEGIKR